LFKVSDDERQTTNNKQQTTKVERRKFAVLMNHMGLKTMEVCSDDHEDKRVLKE
jgi:hypothetical protein